MKKNSSEDFALPKRGRFAEGEEIEAAVSLRRLKTRMETEGGGDVDVLARRFLAEGGRVHLVDGDQILVDVGGDTFLVPRVFVRPRDE